MNTTEEAQEITARLTVIILHNLRVVASEEKYPRADSDASDDAIKSGKALVTELRRIREEIENALTGAN